MTAPTTTLAAHEDDDDEPYDADDEFLDSVCGMMPDGQCSLAGSEECDWECPRNR